MKELEELEDSIKKLKLKWTIETPNKNKVFKINC